MERTCDICGTTFEGRAGARYCSGRCRTSAYRQRHEPLQAPRRRKPLADVYYGRLRKAREEIESLHRLTRDDRWNQGRRVADSRSGLVNLQGLIGEIIEQLPPED